LALVGALGLAAFVCTRGSASTPSAADQSTESAEVRRATQLGDGLRRRHVDPATRTDEAEDIYDSDERVDRAERAIEAALVGGTDVDTRKLAGVTLSAARADFFASDAGVQRYVELAKALENAAREH
jgi:hypothetical protein